MTLLRVRGLAAAYGKNRVLTDITLSIERGEWFSLLGPNASGKTTLLHCVTGQLAPRSGTVQISGHDIATAPVLAKRHVGYVHPPERLPDLLTGRQCLEVYAAARGLPDLGGEIVTLAEQFRLTPILDQFVDTYSLGTRQKLSVLLGLMGKPPLIVLDEAFSSLDFASALILRKHLQEQVERRDSGVLLATHAMDIVVNYSTHAALLLDGTLARTWTADELRASCAKDFRAFELILAQVVKTASLMGGPRA